MSVEVRGLCKRFGGDTGRLVLQDVSLRVRAGEYIAIMGESGAGKSTLLNLIAGLERPDAGEIRIEGIQLGALDERARTLLRRQRLGFVFQAFHLLPYLSVARNVGLPLALNRTGGAEAALRVEELLAAVGLAGRGTSAATELSGGEMQRVAIARSLANQPELIIADEPTGELDRKTGASILALIQELQSDGLTVVMATHDPHAAGLGDRVIQMEEVRA